MWKQIVRDMERKQCQKTQDSMDQGMPSDINSGSFDSGSFDSGSVVDEEEETNLVPDAQSDVNVLGTESEETQLEQEMDATTY